MVKPDGYCKEVQFMHAYGRTNRLTLKSNTRTFLIGQFDQLFIIAPSDWLLRHNFINTVTFSSFSVTGIDWLLYS